MIQTGIPLPTFQPFRCYVKFLRVNSNDFDHFLTQHTCMFKVLLNDIFKLRFSHSYENYTGETMCNICTKFCIPKEDIIYYKPMNHVMSGNWNCPPLHVQVISHFKFQRLTLETTFTLNHAFCKLKTRQLHGFFQNEKTCQSCLNKWKTFLIIWRHWQILFTYLSLLCTGKSEKNSPMSIIF